MGVKLDHSDASHSMIGCWHDAKHLLAVCASFVAASLFRAAYLHWHLQRCAVYYSSPLDPASCKPDESEDQMDYKWDCNMLRGKILDYLAHVGFGWDDKGGTWYACVSVVAYTLDALGPGFWVS